MTMRPAAGAAVGPHYVGAWRIVKASTTLALICLLSTVLLAPPAWGERPDVASPSPSPSQASPFTPSPEGPDLSQTLHLTAEQVAQMRDINERVRQRLVAERRTFRESVLGVLTEAQKTRLRELIRTHQENERDEVDLQKELRLTSQQLDALKRLQVAAQLRLDAMWIEYVGQIKAMLSPTQAAALDDYLKQQATAP